jgi:hypothetical protein
MSETWDSMIPQILQNVSPAGRELLHHETRPGQPTSQFSEIGAGELEGWTLRFLTSLSHTPGWKRTVSLMNEYHQTLAHLAVLFRYTTLLEKVAQWGIDVDVQDVNGFTALHCAYSCGDLDSVGILKGYGADEDIEDNLGRRPLDMYTPSTSDLGKGSPSSDRTSSSAQMPTAGEEDWEALSMAFLQSCSVSIGTGTSNLRQRATTSPKHSASVSSAMTPKRELELLEELERCKELRQLEDIFNKSVWLLDDLIEPVIGHPSCPALAEKYGIRGASCYTVFVQVNDDDTYGCHNERCRALRAHSLEEAIRHQRYYHFDHRPFECIPPSGAHW